MDIQSTLTQAIEVIVMSFVALIIFDFVDGLYVVPLPPIAIAQSSANRESIVTPPQFEALSNTEQLEVEPQQIPLVTSQFEEISDPWTLELEPYNSSIETQPVVLPLPTLKLLLPVTEIQTQPKSKSRSRKTNSPELIKPKAKKTDVMTTAKRKPGRSRKAA